MKAWLVPVVAFLIFPAVAWSQAQEDPCEFEGTVDEYFSADRAVDAAKRDTKTAMMGRANDDGLAGGRLDLLRRAFVALDLGTVSEEKGALVFNFNPEKLNFKAGGQLSPRILVHEAALFSPLEKKLGTLTPPLTDAELAKAKEDLSNSLQDLDDVEVRLRWARSMASSSASGNLDSVAKELFTPVYSESLQPVARAFAARLAGLNQTARNANLADTQVSTVCGDSGARAEFLTVAELWNTETKKEFDKLGSKLSKAYFFALADMIEGQPKLVVEGAYRRRDGAAGPDETSGSLRFEIGSKSYWGWKKWVKKDARALDKTSAQDYLKGLQGTTLPLFSLKVDWTDVAAYDLPLPGNGGRFVQEGSESLSVALQGGMYLGRTRAHRLALEAKYDWASSDRQDRFVSTLSWTEKPGAELAELIGGSDVVVSLVWANKPEFRGEVNKELGLRAGLKWSFGGAGE